MADRPPPLDVHYTPPFNGLDAAEAERLAWINEECGEVILAIGKILRHGYESRHPRDPNGPTNRADLQRELGHVDAAVHLLQQANDIDARAIMESSKAKRASVKQWLHHQDDLLTDADDLLAYDPPE